LALTRLVSEALARTCKLGFLVVEGALQVLLGVLQPIDPTHALQIGQSGGEVTLDVLLGGEAPGVALSQEGDAARVGFGGWLQQQKMLDRRFNQAAIGVLFDRDQPLFNDLDGTQSLGCQDRCHARW
jgi:hypothetical protein